MKVLLLFKLIWVIIYIIEIDCTLELEVLPEQLRSNELFLLPYADFAAYLCKLLAKKESICVIVCPLSIGAPT